MSLTHARHHSRTPSRTCARARARHAITHARTHTRSTTHHTLPVVPGLSCASALDPRQRHSALWIECFFAVRLGHRRRQQGRGRVGSLDDRNRAVTAVLAPAPGRGSRASVGLRQLWPAPPGQRPPSRQWGASTGPGADQLREGRRGLHWTPGALGGGSSPAPIPRSRPP